MSVEPTGDWVAWGEVRRAAVMLALFDLVLGFPPMIGTAARHIREWSPTAWAAIVVLGIGPLLTTLLWTSNRGHNRATWRSPATPPGRSPRPTGPSMARTRAARGDRLRGELLDAAEHLLNETGDERAVTIRAIVDRVGVTPPSLYRHFDSKEDLVLAAVARRFGPLAQAIGAGAGDPHRMAMLVWAGLHGLASLTTTRPASDQPAHDRPCVATDQITTWQPGW